MTFLVALLLGFLSGGVLYSIAHMALPIAVFPPILDDLLFLAGWALSSHFLLRGAPSALRVLTRGFFVGIVDCLGIIASVPVFIANPPIGPRPVTDAYLIFFAFFARIASVVLVPICLIGFIISSRAECRMQRP
jgi:hypothetical protein